jgi:hypothetical protein
MAEFCDVAGLAFLLGRIRRVAGVDVLVGRWPAQRVPDVGVQVFVGSPDGEPGGR